MGLEYTVDIVEREQKKLKDEVFDQERILKMLDPLESGVTITITIAPDSSYWGDRVKPASFELADRGTWLDTTMPINRCLRSIVTGRLEEASNNLRDFQDDIVKNWIPRARDSFMRGF